MSRLSHDCSRVLQRLPGRLPLDETEKKALRPCHCLCLYVEQNAGFIHKWTPFTLAANLNHIQCMKTLIKIGADEIYSPKYKCIALTEAIEKGYDEIVEILIKSGVRMEHAVLGDYKTVAELLVKSGVDVNDGSLGIAVERGNKEFVDFLLQSGAEVNICGKSTNPPLIIAIRNFRYKGCVETLISAGADVNIRGSDGISNLMYAVECGDDKLADVLVKAGANVNEVDNCYMTPLIRAVMRQNKTCIEQLIKAGADVNMITQYSPNTPISALSEASKLSPELTYLLIKAGADVNIPSCNGGVLALDSHSRLQSACLLLKADVKINIFNHNNVNTLKRHIAEQHPYVNRKMCMLLFAAGEIIDDIIIKKFHDNGNVEQVKVPDFLFSLSCLQHLCRETIRKHLISLDPHKHLFGRVPRLGLPTLLTDYLLYDVSLDDVDSDSDCNNGDD